MRQQLGVLRRSTPKPAVECLHYGNAAAALVVGGLSCSEAMPALGQVEQMIEEQRAKVRTTFSA